MMRNSNHTASLGFVATERAKTIKIQNQVLNLDTVTGKDIMHIKGTATVFDTLRLIEKIVKRDSHLLKPLAIQLKKQDLNQTLHNNWKWLYTHIDYRLDTKGTEQVRTPLRLVSDAYGDCDCFTTFLGALLREQKIKFSIRMTKYDADWQHVYIVVAKDQNNPKYATKQDYYTLDCVLNQYNQEVPFTDKHDVIMNLVELSGIPNQVPNLEKIKNQLLHIAYTQHGLIKYKAQGVLAVWDKPEARNKLLVEFNNAFNAEEQLGRKGKTIVGKILRAPKKIVDKIGDTKVGGAIAKANKKILDSKVGRFVKRFNPVSTLARNGYLLMLQENIGQQAVKLGWGLVSRETFLKYSDDVDYHNKAIESLKKVENMFDDMGGKKSSLHENIKQGFNQGLKNGKIKNKSVQKLQGLGIEPTTTAALIAAGTSVFAVAGGLLDSKLKQDFAIKQQNALNTSTAQSIKLQELELQKQISQSQSYQAPAQDKENKNNLPLYIGLGVGGLALVGGIAYAVTRKRATPTLSGANHAAKKTVKKSIKSKTKNRSKTITI